jgi:hypothetical protein
LTFFFGKIIFGTTKYTNFHENQNNQKNIMSFQNHNDKYIKISVILLAAGVFAFWAFSVDRPLFDHFGFVQNQMAMFAQSLK